MNVPLLPYYLSQVLFNHSDKWMIDRMIGRGEAAKYGIAYSIAIIIIFIINAINNSYIPWFYNRFRVNDLKDNRKVSLGLATLIGFLLLGVIAIAPEVMMIMNKSYYDALWIIPPVSMSLLLLFYTQLFLNVEFYYEAMNGIVKSSIIPAIVNVVLNYLLLPRFGYYAAGYTTLISYVFFAYANYYYAVKQRKIHGKDIKDMFDLRGMLILLAIFLFCGFVLLLLYKHIVARYVLIVVVFGLIGINYKVIYKAVMECLHLFR